MLRLSGFYKLNSYYVFTLAHNFCPYFFQLETNQQEQLVTKQVIEDHHKESLGEISDVSTTACGNDAMSYGCLYALSHFCNNVVIYMWCCIYDTCIWGRHIHIDTDDLQAFFTTNLICWKVKIFWSTLDGLGRLIGCWMDSILQMHLQDLASLTHCRMMVLLNININHHKRKFAWNLQYWLESFFSTSNRQSLAALGACCRTDVD